VLNIGCSGLVQKLSVCCSCVAAPSRTMRGGGGGGGTQICKKGTGEAAMYVRRGCL
jgi:hypothetical protein